MKRAIFKVRSRRRAARSGRFEKGPRSLFQYFYSFILSIFRLLTPGQWLLLFFAINIGVAHAFNSMQAKPSSQDKSGRKSEKDRVIKEACTNTSLPIFNKPKVVISIQNGMINPLSCQTANYICNNEVCAVDPDSQGGQKCAEELGKFSRFASRNNEVHALRERTRVKVKEWNEKLAGQVPAIANELTPASRSTFHDIRRKLIRISESFIVAAESALVGGNCEEHTRTAERILFLGNNKHHLGMNAARVTLESSRLGFSHVFLLVTNEPGDFITVTGLEEVNKELSKLKGMICDAWNHEEGRELENMETTINGLYTADGQYDKLVIAPIPMDFAELEKLPSGSPAQRLICNELQDLGLPKESAPEACRFFQDAEKAQPSSHQARFNATVKLK